MATRRKTTTKKRASARKSAETTPRGGADAVAASIRKRRGKEAVIFKGTGRGSQISGYIPTGIFPLDWYVCGRGGLPMGRLVELYSDEGGGKTSLALQALGHVQRAGGFAMYVDGEQSMDDERCATFGVDTDDLLITEPYTLEEALDDVSDALDNLKGCKGPKLIVIDSIAALPTRRQVEGEEPKVGEVAGLLTKRMKPMLKQLTETETCLLCINQMREAIGNMFQDTYTPGGRFFKHACSLRIQIMGGSKIDAEHSGKDVTMMVTKNRMGPPFRKARVRLFYDSGWDDEWSTIKLAKDLKIMEAGARFTTNNYEKARAALAAAVMD